MWDKFVETMDAAESTAERYNNIIRLAETISRIVGTDPSNLKAGWNTVTGFAGGVKNYFTGSQNNQQNTQQNTYPEPRPEPNPPTPELDPPHSQSKPPKLTPSDTKFSSQEQKNRIESEQYVRERYGNNPQKPNSRSDNSKVNNLGLNKAGNKQLKQNIRNMKSPNDSKRKRR